MKKEPVAIWTASKPTVIEDSDEYTQQVGKKCRILPGEVARKIESVVTTTVSGLTSGRT